MLHTLCNISCNGRLVLVTVTYVALVIISNQLCDAKQLVYSGEQPACFVDYFFDEVI